MSARGKKCVSTCACLLGATALIDRSQLQETLINVLDHIDASPDYRLVGTGAALLHGVSLPACDVDLLVKDRNSVDVLGAALSSHKCLQSPVWLPEARQYYANYEVNGVEVGIGRRYRMMSWKESALRGVRT